MSTMLKTAAMTLLSKTLQTFLYKYLSDVDVEGVVLPSVYDGSGWGVRLSNVKLRDGVQLMEQMPGKLKKRRRKRKPKPTTTAQRKKQESTTATESSTTSTIRKEDSKEKEETEPKQSLSVDINSASTSPRIENNDDDNDMDVSIHLQDLQQNAPPEDEQERPTTPDQNSKSIFSCFHVSRSSNLNNPPPQTKVHDISLHGTSSSKPEEKKEETFQDFELSFQGLEPASVEVEPVEEEEEEDEYEYEEYEQPLRLCLGENGRIGTLDIR
jgi:hypothetical protein